MPKVSTLCFDNSISNQMEPSKRANKNHHATKQVHMLGAIDCMGLVYSFITITKHEEGLCQRFYTYHVGPGQMPHVGPFWATTFYRWFDIESDNCLYSQAKNRC
eukprot:3378064-Amphidinium_carterae.1